MGCKIIEKTSYFSKMPWMHSSTNVRFSKKYRDHLVYMSKDNMCFCSVNTPLYNIMNATLTTQKNLFDIRICYLSVHPTMNLLAPPRF